MNVTCELTPEAVDAFERVKKTGNHVIFLKCNKEKRDVELEDEFTISNLQQISSRLKEVRGVSPFFFQNLPYRNLNDKERVNLDLWCFISNSKKMTSTKKLLVPAPLCGFIGLLLV